MILTKENHEFLKVFLDLGNMKTIWFCLLNLFLYFVNSQHLEKAVFVTAFFELAAVVVCQPSTVGFNMADVVVMKNLPEVCIPTLKALLASPYCTLIESSLRARISRRRYLNYKLTDCIIIALVHLKCNVLY